MGALGKPYPTRLGFCHPVANRRHSAMANRIAELRTRAGLSQPALAERLGCHENTVGKLERGERKLTEEWMRRIASVLNVAPADLILARGYEALRDAPGINKGVGAPDTQDNLARIDELDIGPGAADGGRMPIGLRREASGDIVEDVPVKQQWVLPSDIAGRVTQSAADRLKILTVQGTSMAPDFLPGDRIMVDTGDLMPSPPGNFIVWDGMNLVIKFVQHLPHSDPPTIRLTSRHPDVAAYDRSVDEAYIQGRVIGKWQWT